MGLLVKKIEFEEKLEDLMNERNKEWANNLSLTDVLMDQQMSMNLRQTTVQQFGRQEQLCTFLIELQLNKEKLLEKYLQPMLRDMATSIVMLYKQYLLTTSPNYVQFAVTDEGKAQLEDLKDQILNYSQVDLNYLAENVYEAFVAPNFN